MKQYIGLVLALFIFMFVGCGVHPEEERKISNMEEIKSEASNDVSQDFISSVASEEENEKKEEEPLAQPSQPVREYPTGELFRLEGMDVDRDGKSEETVTVKREFVGEEVCDTLVVQFTDGRQYVEHMVAPDEAALPRVHVEMVDGLMPGIPLLAVTLTSRTSNYGASDIHFFKLASEEEEIGMHEVLTLLNGSEDSERYEVYQDTMLEIPTGIVNNLCDMNYYVDDLGRTAIRMPMENWGCDWMMKEMFSDVVYIFWGHNCWNCIVGEERRPLT